MTKKHVILLHGITRNTFDLEPFSFYLKRKGYTVHAINYPSTEHTIEELSDFVKEEIEKDDLAKNADQLCFVTHSLGGLITRYYIKNHKPANLDKVVMIGPPNEGSELADFFKESKWLSPLFKKVFGPAGQQLGTKEDFGKANIHDDIDYPLGVIAGDRSLNPLAPWVLEGEHDGIVIVERTKIKGMQDHIVLHAPHSFMILVPEVIRQTYLFLENGAFKHKKEQTQKHDLKKDLT